MERFKNNETFQVNNLSTIKTGSQILNRRIQLSNVIKISKYEIYLDIVIRVKVLNKNRSCYNIKNFFHFNRNLPRMDKQNLTSRKREN